MKTAQKTTAASDEPLSFEKVWKMFQETDRKFQETDRKFQEADRKLQETWEQIAATDRQMKETDKKVGELANRFGDMVEHMVVPNLLSKFKALGFTFEVATRDYKIADEKNRIFVEVDAFLQNGDKVMIVEIKTTPTTRDVDDHIARMEKLRKYADLHHDTRKYLGSVAGAVMSDSVKNYALKKGFFAVIPSGDTFNIIKPEGKYHVKEW
ncbi:MAG: hypothetical protein LBF77_00195 [Spirochaetaceae bacterium]|jgi:hypothetical protein|nr:hypothetical protein [Spirochaetaceae bacterium]